jgi:hypothetical protein
MRRQLRALTLTLAGSALAASVVGPCPCLPETGAVADHGCCAPAEGLRAASPDCCSSHPAAPTAAGPQAAPAPSASALAAPLLRAVSCQVSLPHPVVAIAVSPPSVLRI